MCKIKKLAFLKEKSCYILLKSARVADCMQQISKTPIHKGFQKIELKNVISFNRYEF